MGFMEKIVVNNVQFLCMELIVSLYVIVVMINVIMYMDVYVYYQVICVLDC